MKFKIGDRIETDDGNFGPASGEIIKVNVYTYLIRWDEYDRVNNYHNKIIDDIYILDKQYTRDKKLKELLDDKE